MYKTCDFCYRLYNAIRSNQQFCSERCSIMARRAKKVNYDPIPCAECGEMFKPVRKDQRFCAQKCHDAYYVSHQVKTVRCKYCNSLFETTTLRRVYCDEACAKAAKAERDSGRARSGAVPARTKLLKELTDE